MNGLLSHLVAYADTDAGGVMYHGRYVELAERSRLLCLHGLGWTMARLEAELGLKLVVWRLDTAFQRPARLEECLVATSRVTAATEAHVAMSTEIRRDDVRLASVAARLVGVREGALARLPAALLADLQSCSAEAGGRTAPRGTRAGASLTLVP